MGITTKVVRRSFAAGEVTPEMYGRTDNIKNQTALALCRNAVILPHGPATKRGGTAFVNIAGVSASAVRLIPFVFSATQSMVLELGAGYIRFHTSGATLLEANKVCAVAGNTVTSAAHGYVNGDWVYVGGRYFIVSAAAANTFQTLDTITGLAANPSATATAVARLYTISTAYAAADLFTLKFTQDADVLTVTHPGYPTRELRRLGATNWTLTTPALGGAVAQPSAGAAAGVVATAGTGTAYNKNFYYKITTVTADSTQESLPTTASVAAANDLTLGGAKNTVSWVAAVGLTAPTYRVYKAANNSGQLYGYVGETSDLSFVDDNIIPDYSRNPPGATLRIDTASNYPGAVTYFEQRRVFAGSVNEPQAVWMTRAGTESNLNVSYPSQSEDAVFFRLKAQQQNAIRHLVAVGDLIALTASGVWRIFSNADGAILPSTVSARVQSLDGASHVTPVTTGGAILFVENNGKRVRDVSYSNDERGYITTDRTLLAPHLFNDYTLVDQAFQRSPDKLAWYPRDDGKFVSMTYLPEQQVYAWAQHTTDGFVESVCTVPENNVDVVYMLVRRTLNGQTVRVIERMGTTRFATLADSFFVDCGLTYSGAATTSISGLWHLEGKSVKVLADGGVVGGRTVSAGALTPDLDVAASKVTVGLGFTTDVQTMPVTLDAAPAAGAGTVKTIGNVSILLYRTGVFKAGASTADLIEVPIRTSEAYDSPPNLQTGELDVETISGWERAGQVWLRSEEPVPFTASAITTEVHLAG